MLSPSIRSWSTLPIELVYRILDHVEPYDVLISTYPICARWKSIIDTYQPYQVKLALSESITFGHWI